MAGLSTARGGELGESPYSLYVIHTPVGLAPHVGEQHEPTLVWHDSMSAYAMDPSWQTPA